MSDVVSDAVRNAPPTPMRGALAVVLWACFLGCSWTWVIGMYLPVLLVRDYGLWGWVAFAVPNVIGAAAMGFVLRNPGVSRALVERHRYACLIFSQITVAYQIFMVTAFTGLDAWPIVMLGSFSFWLAGRKDGSRDGLLAAGVWVASLVAFAYLQSRGWLWLEVGRTVEEGFLGQRELIMFIPASVFGFLLCPYLDLTFHRARQATAPGTGRAAFSIGFGVVFFSMIVFSLAYAGALLWPFVDGSADVYLAVWNVFRWHLLWQASFTIAIHWRAMEVTGGQFGLRRKLILAVTAGILALLTVTYGLDEVYQAGPDHILAVNELVYRAFLLLYGTVFPIYVLCCMTPTCRQVAHKYKLVVFAVCAAVSYPLACMAFIANRALWVLPTLAVIVIGRGLIELLPEQVGSD